MANRSLAIDALAGHQLSSGTGRIVGVAATDAALRAAGFTAARGYTGNRLVNIDDGAAGWNASVEPGWYLANNVVQINPPQTKLERLKAGTIALFDQLDAWADGVWAHRGGQDPAKVQMGQTIIWRKRGGVYLILKDHATYTLDQRIAVVEGAIMGAADVTTVYDFYNHWHGTAPDNWLTWIDPADGTRLNLGSAQTVTGTIPDTVHLDQTDFLDDITQ